MKIPLKRLLYGALSAWRVLRAKMHVAWLRCFFRKMGSNIFVYPPILFKEPHKIEIGSQCIIRAGVTLNGRSEDECGIRLGTGVTVREWTYIDAYGGSISIGDYCAIGHHCVIGGHGGLVIGPYTMIGGATYIIPSNHVFSGRDVPYMLQGETRKGISIGANVWIGAQCVILDGVTIGDDCVVGAGSVVAQSIPAGSFAVGVPARVRRPIR